MEAEKLPSFSITNIRNLNTIVIKQNGGNFFISTKDSIIIDIPGLEFLLYQLVKSKSLPIEVLERIINANSKDT